MSLLESRVTPTTLLGTLTPPDQIGPQAYALFGSSVAAGVTYRVVGAPKTDVAGKTDVGQAFVYDAVTNALVATLDNPTPEALDYFGCSVAVTGSLILVGAYGDNTGASNAGAAYLFDMSSPMPTAVAATFNNPVPVASDQFGFSVAMAGKYVAIGANNNHIGAFSAGSTYLYDLTSGTPTNAIRTIDNPTPGNNEHFGGAVAMAGNRLVIGADQADTDGIAYVYDVSLPPATSLIATIKNPLAANGGTFGYSVATAGNLVVVGARRSNIGASAAGSAYVFDMTSPTPTVPLHSIHNPAPTSLDEFGTSVAVGGKYVAVGAPGEDIGQDDSGAVYLYDINSATPTVPLATLANPVPDHLGAHGTAVAMAGSRLVVGSGASLTASFGAAVNSAYVYDVTNPATAHTTLVNATTAAGDNFGRAVAAGGRYVVVGAPNDATAGLLQVGRVFVYDLLSPTPSQPLYTFENPAPAEGDQFGAAVAYAGGYVVVGEPFNDTGAMNSGSVHVYNLNAGSPQTPIYTFNRATPYAQDNFGTSVAISGTDIVIGAPNAKINFSDTGSGAMFVHSLASPTPETPVWIMNNPEGVFQNDDFGQSVSISGNRVAVGSPRGGAIVVGQGPLGIAYVYDLASATPTIPVYTLTNPTGAANDAFGNAVSIDGDIVAVGAPDCDTAAAEAGAAYVFNLASPTPIVPTMTLASPDLVANQNFGVAVAVAGTKVVVAADGTDTIGSTNTAVYLFDSAATPPTAVVDITPNPTADAFDAFGRSVAVSGSLLVVGAPGDDVQNTDQGSAYLYRLNPPQVTSVVINNGQVQRSMVTSLKVTFDQPVAVAGPTSGAFTLQRQSDGALVTLSASWSGNTVTLSFTGGASEAGSLADGRYTLTINANSVSNVLGKLDGDGNGLGGDNFVLVGNLVNKLFRLYGDADGSGQVTSADYLAFRLAYLTNSPTFDFDGSGQIDSLDFLAFRLRFLQSV